MKTIIFNIKCDTPSYLISICRQDVRNQNDFSVSQLSYPGDDSFRLLTAARPQALFIGDRDLYVRGVRHQHDADIIEIQRCKLLATFSELLIRPYAFYHERCVL